MDASHNGNVIPTDQRSVFNYILNLCFFFLFYTVLTIVDYYCEFHAIPPLDLCVSHNSQPKPTLNELILYSVALAPYFLLAFGYLGYSWSLFRLHGQNLLQSVGNRTQRIRESLNHQIPFRDFIFSIILLFVIAILGSPNYYLKHWMNVNTSEYKITVCMILLIADILKAPLTIKLTFRVNRTNQRNTREDRRLAILEHAELERLNNAAATEGSPIDNPLHYPWIVFEEDKYSDPNNIPILSDYQESSDVIPSPPFPPSDIPYIDESE